MTATLAILTLLVTLLLASMLVGIIRAGVWAVGRARRGEPLLPPVTRPAVPWGIGSVALVMLAWVAFSLAISILYSSLTGGSDAKIVDPAGGPAKPIPRELTLAEVMLLVTLVNGVLLLTIPPLLRLTSGARLADLGFDPRGLGRQVRVGAAAFLVVSPFVYAFNGLTALIWKPTSHKLEKMVRDERSAGIAQLAIVSAVLLAPAAEELIFRGVLQSWLYQFFRRGAASRRRCDPPLDPPETAEPPASAPIDELSELASTSSPPVDDLFGPVWLRLERAEILAILLTSMLFGVVHLPQWPAPLAIFVLSLGLGLVYQRTGSLVSSVVMHALFNGLGTLLLFYALQASDVLAKTTKPPAGCVVSGEHLGALPQRP